MSECMGILSGTYDAKTGGGFQAGGMSLHNIMAGHGPDADAHERASNMELKPQKIMTGAMAFMFGTHTQHPHSTIKCPRYLHLLWF